jgi:hypothetical protein
VSDVNSVLESERLRECLKVTQATLWAIEEKVEIVLAQLADADGRVVGKFLLAITILLHLSSSFI